MAKVAALSALLAALLFVSLAAATTTVTTVQVNEAEENRRYGSRESCREQLEIADELRDCEDFLREQVRRGGFRGRRFGGVDPYGSGGRFGGESRRLRECCQQLRQVDDRCRCQGLREILREQQQQLRGFGEEREDLERITENIPQICGVSPGRCDIRRGGYGRWD
ncbi:hypothetical protein MLD38_015802 [Melastoma candidum]|uniref:Uncharacterized protein n=1 Tax=Melastoma candidum TaxID=119954 RepID=A0ACB9RQT4_9MYRT|nr:hypothetical protein MLD38_015802 [Melastoma candidum]